MPHHYLSEEVLVGGVIFSQPRYYQNRTDTLSCSPKDFELNQEMQERNQYQLCAL